MEFKNFLIIASKKDFAGINITTQLSQCKQKFNFYLTEKDIVDDSGLDYEKLEKFDFVIFASKHQSKEKTKTLSVHAPGNWREAMFGGKPEKVCPSSAQFLKQSFQKLKQNAEKYNLKNYKITLECTHHGPLIDKPCMFIEIGSTETEWKDRKAGFVIAKTIEQIINEFKSNNYNENAIAIGGPHYCPNFNKIQGNSNFAISHIIPQYALPLKKEMIEQAISKTTEEIDLVILDWKGLGNSEQRRQVVKILEEFYIRFEKTTNIKK